ncbi:hypothetical protein [Streptomyces sp. NPDC091371]|uniref:hypothetical protein n=1 Tax=Streptomyces sp. NPDC091371 TaxID=3155303 RepID=UPI0034296523
MRAGLVVEVLACALERHRLLALFALGTNMGICAVVAIGEHGELEAADVGGRVQAERDVLGRLAEETATSADQDPFP